MSPGASIPRGRAGRGHWPRRIAFFLAAATILWLTSAYAVAYLLTRRLGGPYSEPPPSLSWSVVEPLRIRTSDGEELGAWFLDGGERAPLVLLLHGNGDDRSACLGRAKIAARIGCPILMISFRAHGDSTGDRNDFGRGARHDVIAAVKWLEARRPESRIVVWGMSLGAAAAIFAAGELGERVSGYILECPYRDLRTAVRHRTATYLPPVLDAVAYLGLCIVAPLVLPDVDGISPIEAATGFPQGVPVLLLAGSADDRATPEEAEEIRGRMKGPVELLVIAGGTHAKLSEAQPQVYEAAVSRFLTRW